MLYGQQLPVAVHPGDVSKHFLPHGQRILPGEDLAVLLLLFPPVLVPPYLVQVQPALLQPS